MKYFLLSIICMFFLSCSTKQNTIINGTNIILKFQPSNSQDDIEKSVSILKNRFSTVISNDKEVDFTINQDIVNFSVPGMIDSVAISQLIERNRMMKLCYSIELSLFPAIRDYLQEYLYLPIGEKPYKSKSVIGLVEEKQKSIVEELILSDDFRQKFPEVDNMYWGVKQMSNRHVLFMTATSSPIIDETMYENVGGHIVKQGKVGALSFTLKDQYANKIGKLTGNDSTYLLHLFHEEVYISKIIEPHITEPSFGMEGAFKPIDAKVLAALWNSEELVIKPEIQSIKLYNQ